MFCWNRKNPNSAILLNYDDDDFSQGHGQIKEAFRVFTKVDIVKPYISDNDFTSSKEGNNIRYKLYVFDIQYQKNLECAQPIKVELIFSEKIPAGIYGFALVFTNNLVIISSDGQNHFDLI